MSAALLLKPLAPILAVLLAGCAGGAGLHLYSDVRDKQGEAARKAWSEVDLSAVVAAERANLGALLQAELDTQDQTATAIRDFQLRYMVQSPSVQVGLIGPLNSRIDELAGSAQAVVDAQAKLRTLRAAQLKVTVHGRTLKAAGLKVPSCEHLANGQVPADVQAYAAGPATAFQKAAVTSSVKEIATLCAQNDNLSDAAAYAGLGGAFGAARAEYEQNLAQLSRRKADARPLQDAYRKAKADYDAAVQDASASPQARDKTKELASRLAAAVAALQSASDAFSIQFLSEERLKSLDAFVNVVTESAPGKDPPADAGKAVAAFIVIPGFFDDAQAALADAKKPLIVPLLMRKNFEQLNLESATRDIAASEAIVRLSRELMDALYLQAEQLVLAQAEAAQPKVAAVHGQAFFDAFARSSPEVKEALYSAAARYLDAVGRLDARRYKIEYARIAAHHERALAYAEVNVKQWDSLIGLTVNQVADYHAAGFKAEQISNLLNTLGIFYIGAGVNK